jgi:hypothetical protein
MIATTLIYGERSRTMVIRIGDTFMGEQISPEVSQPRSDISLR